MQKKNRIAYSEYNSRIHLNSQIINITRNYEWKPQSHIVQNKAKKCQKVNTIIVIIALFNLTLSTKSASVHQAE